MLRHCAGRLRDLWLFGLILLMAGCVTTSEPVSFYQPTQREKPTGFFERLLDNFTERECNVGRFTCDYGLGAAGEPCDCVGPDNVVFSGWTVK